RGEGVSTVFPTRVNRRREVGWRIIIRPCGHRSGDSMRSASLIALALATGTIAAGCTADVVIDNDNLGCDFDTDCFADEFCDAGVCVPLGAATYQACGVSEDCADPAELCYEVDIPEAGTFGAFCSND